MVTLWNNVAVEMEEAWRRQGCYRKIMEESWDEAVLLFLACSDYGKIYMG